MMKFVEGDSLTLEDVKQALKEAHDKNIIVSANVDKKEIESHLSKDGFYEFESWEEYRKAFGVVPLEEAFKQDK